ncbi:CDK5 and ABL1 enzyme substrate 2 isoform X1 [Trichosurus vulpecula]|uniref:CDK5 and ABL1 enzyme substrate 2 isoform X1 n=1 Tax=Trichosurus vulpecula TaxID=9337 RepID=UPI00186AFD6B|nr:CDK5 and ABL1 enzyme substrate 2 isoform X1 [Trichosurus vulpecula]
MAAAAAGGSSSAASASAAAAATGTGSSSKPPPTPPTPREHPAPRHPPQLRKRGDSRRRQAALFFLNNISLDGRPPSLFPGGEKPPPPTQDESAAGQGAAAGEAPAGHPLPPSAVGPSRPGAPNGPPPAPALLLQLPKDSPLPPVRGEAEPPGVRGGVFLPQLLLLGGQLGSPAPLTAPPSAAAGAAAAAGMTGLGGKGGPPTPQGLLSPTQTSTGFTLEVQRQRRRFISQRCSLEFLEDIVEYATVQRTKHISGSPRHKGLKKTHFIKNMRQYDTKNSRIVLICAKRSLCAAFSILPYGESIRISDIKAESQKQRHPSGGVSVSSEMVFVLEGVELGADGKVVSYAKFLYPTNALVTHKSDNHTAASQPRSSVPRTLPGSRYKSATAKSVPSGTELGSETGDSIEYNPNLLDDPQWPCGKHKRVLIFASYMTTVIEYVKPSDLKKDMNETFKEKFPHIKLTLSKIRSLKREMRNLSEECNLEPVTVSMAYVYFEKLVLQGKLNKQNRKLCAGACVLLAAKISSDLRKNEVKQLIDKLEERFRFNRRDLIGFEFTVLVALELALYLPENQVLPHYRRLTQQS